MKKYILTIITCTMTLPLLAFNFNGDKFEIDSNIKTEINDALVGEINTVTRENKEIKLTDNEIVSAIKKEMNSAIKEIKRNCNLRKNIFTRGYVEEQKIQKQRYENMLKWDVPTQLFNYIKANFDLNRIDRVQVVCVHHDETIVEVRFTLPGRYVIAYYDYNYKVKQKNSPITHIMD